MEGFADKINRLYNSKSHDCGGAELADTPKFISAKTVNDALKNIYNGLDVANEIEENLFRATWDALNIATDKGFGQIEFGHPDYDFVQELKYNNAVFAAFKTHRQQNDLAKQLLDQDGEVKSFTRWKKDVSGILSHYNVNWLQTEYSTAVIRARTAAQFKKFEREKHIYPNLKWLPSVAAQPRESHVKFYNKVWAQDDPFWLTNQPGKEWGCKCGLTSTKEPANGEPLSKVKSPKPSQGLENNPAQDAKLFSDSNAYVKNGYGSKKKRLALAKDMADKVTLEKWAEDVLKEKKSRGLSRMVGSIGKEAKKHLRAEGITIKTNDIILSDKAVLHMMRDAKTTSPLIDDLSSIKQDLNSAEMYYDSKRKNLLYFIERGGGQVLKFAVQPNYRYKIDGKKQRVNYVIAGKYVDARNMNQKSYTKIRLK